MLTLFAAAILMGPSALAQTPDYLNIDAGTTPDDPFYFFDTTWDGVQMFIAISPEDKAALAAEISAERFAEMHQMMEENNWVAAQSAAQGAESWTGQFATALESLPPIVDPVALAEIGELSHYVNDYSDAVHEQYEELLASGELDEATADTLPVDALVESTVDAQAGYVEAKDEVIAAAAEEQGITQIEAGIQYSNAEEDVGLTDVQKDAVATELVDARDAATELEEAYLALPDGEEKLVLGNMVEDAKLNLQQSEYLFKAGDYDAASGNLIEGQHWIFNAQDYAGGELTEDQKAAFEEQFTNVEAIRDEVTDGSATFVEEWEANKDALTAAYPEEAAILEQRFEQEQNVVAIATALEESYSTELNDLITAGEDPSEAARILAAQQADEYRKAYGEEFVPPGFIVTGEIELPEGADATAVENFADPEIAAGAGGGFVIGTQYVDPVTDYKYEFVETGWRFTTPSGQAYEHPYPEGYEPASAFENGNEEYSYTVDTPEGLAQYTYTPTGYEVVTPEGTTETYAYTPGQYKLPDGKTVNYKPTGYEIRDGAVVEAKYDYNPEFNAYASADGTVYRPPDGAYYHYKTDYSAVEGKYTYAAGSDTWTYDPKTASWASGGGETYKPPTAVVAPVGYESDGVYRSPSGVRWDYNSGTGTWGSTSGESYNSANGAYRSATGATTTHAYDYSRPTYGYDARTQEYRFDTVTREGTGTWTYNPQANIWTSGSGETTEASRGYVPPTTLNYPTPVAYQSPSFYPYPSPGQAYVTPAPYQTPSYQTPNFAYQTPYYSYPSPSYVYPSPGTYPTPSYVYPTPYQYPTPGNTYPSPYYAYPTPGQYYQTPNYYIYPTPSSTYPTPAYTYPSPYYSYPSPSDSYQTPYYAYPSPSSYPTPSYTYPTPGTEYAYPTPSTTGYSYPSPSYATPYTYPTPGSYPTPYYQSPTYYAYPTPSADYVTPTYYSYPSPSEGSYPYPTPSYPSPYSYPTPGTGYSYPSPSYSYPTPSSYTYPTPGSAYGYPSPSYTYPSPTGTYVTPSYSTPSYAYPTPTEGGYSYPSPYPYPTPSEGGYPYPTPYASPSEGYSYPSPGSYPTPSEGYAYPTPYGTPESYGTPYDYPSPYGTP